MFPQGGSGWFSFWGGGASPDGCWERNPCNPAFLTNRTSRSPKRYVLTFSPLINKALGPCNAQLVSFPAVLLQGRRLFYRTVLASRESAVIYVGFPLKTSVIASDWKGVNSPSASRCAPGAVGQETACVYHPMTSPKTCQEIPAPKQPYNPLNFRSG